MTPKSLGFKAVDLHFGTFDYTLQCIVGPVKNVQEYVRWKMSWPDLQWDGLCRGACFCKPGWAPVIWIPRRPRTPREYSTLSHEMFHAVRQMLEDWVGMPLNHDTEEAYAHALGFGITTVLEAL